MIKLIAVDLIAFWRRIREGVHILGVKDCIALKKKEKKIVTDRNKNIRVDYLLPEK